MILHIRNTVVNILITIEDKIIVYICIRNFMIELHLVKYKRASGYF